MERATTWKAVWERAERDLTIRDERGSVDVLLWEHVSRVALTARRLAELPQIQARKPTLDVIAAVALYHDAGYVVAYDGKGFPQHDCLNRSGDDHFRELAVQKMTQSLAPILDGVTLRQAADTLDELGRRPCRSIEAQIVSDADNLHQLGLLSLWPAIRHTVATGRGVADLIERWNTWLEYGYWEARRECFYLEEAQQLASLRQETYGRFIACLANEYLGNDLDEILPPLTVTEEADQA